MNIGWRPGRLFAGARFLALAFGMGCLLATSAASAPADSYDGYPDRSGDAAEETYDGSWEYDPYYIFGLTRHMSDSDLPRAGQIALYPLAFIIDMVAWPMGALGGLAGK